MKIYLDDILVFNNGTYADHLKKVNQVLERLQSKNLAVNALKSFWAVDEVDYLGFRLTKHGVLPQARKIAAIKNMAAPANKRQLRRFAGMVNHCRCMWRHRSHVLMPLTELTRKGIPFKWLPEHQAAFDEMKSIVSEEMPLSFPDYNKPFQIHVDASKCQLGAVLMQGRNTLAMFSKKLSAAQRNYGVGEKEMLH